MKRATKPKAALGRQPGESKQKEVRYLDVREGKLDEGQFVDWVEQASKLTGVRM
jgi:hypothetical protein